jgi:hypothetical protein
MRFAIKWIWLFDKALFDPGVSQMGRSVLKFSFMAFLFSMVSTWGFVSSAVTADDSAKASIEPSPPVAAEPFAYADFTWMNGNSRQHESLIETKYFTGEFIADTNYIYDFAKPKDHTLIGATSAGRTQEIQVQQLGIGGDFHYQNVRGRIMTQFGMYSTMTPRNDASPARGQWDLADAYRYVSEAYGGYHWDIWNGINLDAGIFMSYVGLFSYYNFENWAYQASYVSANTPWFFNGLRLQVFPSDHLKTEFWLINGWQSYGMFNESPGLGYQIAWRPTGDLAFVFNGYYGYDTQDASNRMRIHSDNSMQYKYIDKPSSKVITKAAFSLTGDIGCEDGDGVRCYGDENTPSQNFLGAMAYNRLWFNNNKMAFTVGGGAFSNPGRYLVLIPPIQQPTPGATQGQSASPQTTNCPNCFQTGAGPDGKQQTGFHAWDFTVGFDWMPNEYITWRGEYNHRKADVNYFAGPRGITSPDGYNTTTQPAGWTPDLTDTEDRVNIAMLVRF